MKGMGTMLMQTELEQGNALAASKLFVVRRREDRDLAAKVRDSARDQYKYATERPTAPHKHQQLRLDLFAAERKLADAEDALLKAVDAFNAEWNPHGTEALQPPTATEAFYERGGAQKFGGT
jgi:hypothetical protein